MSDNIQNSGEITPALITTMVGIFIGFYSHSLDSKRRLTIPLEWRQQVGVPEGLFIIPLHEKCLYVLPAREVVRRLSAKRGRSIADFEGAEADRVIGSSSELISWDSQGRIRIRDELLAHADLADQVALVGAIERFELWNPKAWDKHRAASGAEVADSAGRSGL